MARRDWAEADTTILAEARWALGAATDTAAPLKVDWVRAEAIVIERVRVGGGVNGV